MINCFSGEYFNTLDEKGRIAFPAKLRTKLDTDTVWVTKGMGEDRSLLIYPPETWEATVNDLKEKLSIYNNKTRWLFRKFISPAQEINIDKNGRIAIPQSLREYAHLKKDCVFLGMNSIIELWDTETYRIEEEKAGGLSVDIFEELGNNL